MMRDVTHPVTIFTSYCCSLGWAPPPVIDSNLVTQTSDGPSFRHLDFLTQSDKKNLPGAKGKKAGSVTPAGPCRIGVSISWKMTKWQRQKRAASFILYTSWNRAVRPASKHRRLLYWSRRSAVVCHFPFRDRIKVSQRHLYCLWWTAKLPLLHPYL